VLMFRSRKPSNTEYVPVGHVKRWANAGEEIEILGRRLDAIREAKKKAKRKSWAKKHWTQAEAIVLRKWKLTVQLRDVALVQVLKKECGPKIDYSWWEPSEEVAMRFPILDSISQLFADKIGLTSPNFERAWAMAQEEKLQKARLGQA